MAVDLFAWLPTSGVAVTVAGEEVAEEAVEEVGEEQPAVAESLLWMGIQMQNDVRPVATAAVQVASLPSRP